MRLESCSRVTGVDTVETTICAAEERRLADIGKRCLNESWDVCWGFSAQI